MDSLDPNYGKISDTYMAQLTSAFGSDHWYQLDGYFNGGTAPWLDSRARGGLLHPHSTGEAHSSIGTELPPPPANPLWRRRAAAAYAGLSRTDPHAVWSFQGFAFETWSGDAKASALRGFIDAVPRGRFVIVDMDYGYGEWIKWASNGFWDTPFIWTKLHDFGGTDGMKGNLSLAAAVPSDAIKAGAAILGSGFTPEGIDQNPAYVHTHLPPFSLLPAPAPALAPCTYPCHLAPAPLALCHTRVHAQIL